MLPHDHYKKEKKKAVNWNKQQSILLKNKFNTLITATLRKLKLR
jgi:hypothetical protein